MTTPEERRKALADILEQRVLVIDGAMGTMLHEVPLSIEADYLGRENCPEILNVTRPDVIQAVHRAYLEAGTDIIETNTFGGARMTLEDNRLEDRAYELNFDAARIARFSQILALLEKYRGIERVKDRAQVFTDKARQIIG